MSEKKWVQVNLPKNLVAKIDELIENEDVFYANRNQFCASILIKEVEKIIDRNLILKDK